MGFLESLYNNSIGRLVLKVGTRPWVSKIVGAYLDTPLSKVFVRSFIKKSDINLDEFEENSFRNFNECFTRKIKAELRPIGDGLVSPCDGLLSVYDIKDGLVVPVKASRYSISDLLRNEDLAKEYDGGKCLVFRLCTHHYHRYAYPVSGSKGDNVFLKGILHTVRPFALRDIPVFVENSREYTVIESKEFGQVVQMEVGALMVGKIDNYHGRGGCIKGDEKGKFLYGGSTIILLIKKEKAKLNPEFSEEEKEVKLGEKIGEAMN